MKKLLFTLSFLSSIYTFAQYPLTSAGYISNAPALTGTIGIKFMPAGYINAKGAVSTNVTAVTGLYVQTDNASNLPDIGLVVDMGTTSKLQKYGIFSAGNYNSEADIVGIDLDYKVTGSGQARGLRVGTTSSSPWGFDATSNSNSVAGASKGGDFLGAAFDLADGTGTAYGLYSRGTAGVSYGVFGEANGTSTSKGVAYGIFGKAYGAATNYAGYFAGDVTVTGVFHNPSDAKLKQNINGIDNALSKVMQLIPSNYEFKGETYQELNLSKGTHYGFLAQDVEKVFPGLVTEREMIVSRTRNFAKEANNSLGNSRRGKPESETIVTEPIKSVNYLEMIPILAKAIQEQQLLIQKQQTQIETLKTELSDLKGKK